MIENVETKPNIGEIRYGKDIDGKCAKNKDKYIQYFHIRVINSLYLKFILS